MSSSTGKELEEKLLEAGNKLLDPPSSVDELLSLLDVKALAHFPLSSVETSICVLWLGIYFIMLFVGFVDVFPHCM